MGRPSAADRIWQARAAGERVKQACRAKAKALGRPVKYLASAGESKEEMARGIAAREKIQEGLVCVLSCVEPCRTFEVYRNRETRKLELVSRTRKCLYLYHYWMQREFGFLNARLQTWFPFPMQVCLNGRVWLARQMDHAGMKCLRQDNCFSVGARLGPGARMAEAADTEELAAGLPSGRGQREDSPEGGAR